MDLNLIYGGYATLEDLYLLNKLLGLEFVIEDGKVTEIIH